MARDQKVLAKPQRSPTHPGEILREDVLPALNLSVSKAARQLRVTRQILHRVLAGISGISPRLRRKSSLTASGESGGSVRCITA